MKKIGKGNNKFVLIWLIILLLSSLVAFGYFVFGLMKDVTVSSISVDTLSAIVSLITAFSITLMMKRRKLGFVIFCVSLGLLLIVQALAATKSMLLLMGILLGLLCLTVFFINAKSNNISLWSQMNWNSDIKHSNHIIKLFGCLILLVVAVALIRGFNYKDKTKGEPIKVPIVEKIDTLGTKHNQKRMKEEIELPDKKTIDVGSIRGKDVDELWNMLTADNNNPVVLFEISKYYRHHKIDSKARDFWNTLVADGDVERYLIKDKSISTLRFCFVMACRAKQHIDNYNYSTADVIKDLNQYVDDMMIDKNNGGDNFKYSD